MKLRETDGVLKIVGGLKANCVMSLFMVTALLVGFCTDSIAEQPTDEASTKTNFVIFVADDMGWGDSATYGNELIKTPNMDKLASQGVKFTQCYSACGVCSPSRSAILTGRTPYRNGVWRHLSGNHEAHLRDSEITYPELLKDVGYETCHVGKWHLNSKPQFNNPEYPQPGEHGFDYWMNTQNNASPSHKDPDNFFRNGEPVGKLEGYSAQLVAAEAAHWLKDIHDPAKPFAMSVWVHEPHKPIATDSRFESLYEGHANSKYMGNISQLDHALGMVMDALDAQGVSENTLLFFTSDNGPVRASGGTTGGLRGGKRSDHEGGIRVPALRAGLDILPRARPARCRSLVLICLPQLWRLQAFRFPMIARSTASAWCLRLRESRSSGRCRCSGGRTFRLRTIVSRCESVTGRLSATIR